MKSCKIWNLKKQYTIFEVFQCKKFHNPCKLTILLCILQTRPAWQIQFPQLNKGQFICQKFDAIYMQFSQKSTIHSFFQEQTSMNTNLENCKISSNGQVVTWMSMVRKPPLNVRFPWKGQCQQASGLQAIWWVEENVVYWASKTRCHICVRMYTLHKSI